jgi:hypothetical protein
MVNFLLLMMAKVSLAHWLPLAARGKVCRKRGGGSVCLLAYFSAREGAAALQPVAPLALFNAEVLPGKARFHDAG